MLLELTFYRPDWWPEEFPNGRGVILGNPTSLRPVFDVASYFSSCWIEAAEGEILTFDEPHIVPAHFPHLSIPAAWEEIKDKIHIGMEMNAHAGSKIIGRAKILDFEYIPKSEDN